MRITDENRRWWTLGGSCLGLFVLMLDSTVINLALPSIQRDLDSSAAELQWLPNAYLLAIAAFVVTAGRLGDIFGRKLIFQAGMVVFAAGSLLAAVAPGMETLIAGRVVQGLGAAAILPLSLALVSDAFPDDEQARAMGIWAAVSSVALAAGPALGGVVVDLDWRILFWVNPPLAAAGAAVVAAATRESRDEGAKPRIDWTGLVLLTAGLVCVVLPLVEGSEWGWGSATTLGLLAAGLVLLAGFAVAEGRVEDPIVDFSLFRNGPYFGATAAAFSLVGAYWCVMYFESQYLQGVLDYSPSVAGLLILPITVPMIVLSPLAGRLIAQFGSRALMTFGMACGVAGLLLITRTSADSGYGLQLPAFLLFGVALGLVYAPMSAAAMAAMPRAKAGIASGVLAMNRVAAGAIGLAATGAVFTALQRDRIGELADERAAGVRPDDLGELDGLMSGSETARAALADASSSQREALTDAARDAFSYALAGSFWLLVGTVTVGAVLTWAFVRDPERLVGSDVAAEAEGSRELPPHLRHLRHLPHLHNLHHLHYRRFHL